MFFGKWEKGQSIVIIAVAMMILVGMAALIIDGGNFYLNRRNAQTAADAGAWAGAYERCVEHGDDQAIEDAITQYAVAENHASQVESWQVVNNGVEVVVSLTDETFFAKVFGQGTSTVKAKAAAGCYPPGAVDSVLPIAWSCRPPLPGMPTDNEYCEYKAIPWDVMEGIIADPTFDPTGDPGTLLYHDDELEGESATEYLNGVGDLQIYLVMNSSPLIDDVNCTDGTGEPEQFCDLDGDGRVDWTVSERSWLLLDPDSNQAQLDDIVCKKIEFGMEIPGWYPGRSGNIADVYKDAITCVEQTPALIPVFEAGKICANSINPPDDCVLYVPGDYVMRINGADPETYFRVITFAQFYVSCVSTVAKDCPGKTAAMDYLEEHYGSKVAAGYSNEFSIEGYFVTGWVADSSTVGTGSNAIDLGVYVISLTE